jgi:hypothetical protein
MTTTKTPVDLWVEALESDEFQQTTCVLTDKDDKDCCLGVACKVYQREVGGLTLSSDASGSVLYDGNVGTLPEVVRDWFGLASAEGEYVDDGGYSQALTGDNDDRGYTFKEIAAIIRDRPEGLFR